MTVKKSMIKLELSLKIENDRLNSENNQLKQSLSMMYQNLSNDYGHQLQNVRSEFDNKLESIISQFLENVAHQANEIKRLNDQMQSLKDTINQ